MAYGKLKQPKKSYVPLTTWSHEVTWQFKNQIFLRSKDVWPPKLCNRLTYGEAKPIMKRHNSDHVIIRDNVPNWKSDISSSTKSVLQNWQGGDVWWQKATHGVTCLFAVLWGHMKNLKCNISSSSRLMAPKLGRWRGSTHKTRWPLTI